MGDFFQYLLTLLSQFAGGPGPRENNLVRYGLPALLWVALLLVAWSRQRKEELPREKLLVWGFGLGLARELFMFWHVSQQVIGLEPPSPSLHLSEPLEHALTMAAIVMVAGAFIRYLLDDARLARHYLRTGLGMAVVTFGVTWGWWYLHAMANPEARFNRTWAGLIFFIMTAVFAAAAILILRRKRGWLSNVVSLALSLFVLIGVLRVANYAFGMEYANVLCPICNALHILAIPLFGYVYIREQGIEKQQAEEALAAYRDQLESLVDDRTAELTRANEQLQREVNERQQAEAAIARRNTELAAQNAIAATISQSLDLDTILNTALDTVLAVLEMEAGCLYLLDADGQTLVLQTQRGGQSGVPWMLGAEPCSCEGISQQAVVGLAPVVLDVDSFDHDCRSRFVREEGVRTLVSTPLLSKGRAMGALSLASRRPSAMPDDALDLLAGIGRQIGMVVENANLYQEAEHWANDLALLHQVSVFLSSTLDPGEIYAHVTEQSAKLVGCQATGMFRWDAKQQEGVAVASYGLNGHRLEDRRLPLESSTLIPELLAQRRSIPIDDVAADPRVPLLCREEMRARSLLCVPVWGADRPLAILLLVEQEQPRHWRSGDIELVESFVNRAALALENAYLHKQLEWAAALEERQRIAAEMHDGLAQTLSYLALKSTHASELLEQGQVAPALHEHDDMQAAIERAAREVRQSIATLQESPPPRRPLQEWLAELAAEAVQNGELPVTLATRLQAPLYLPASQLEQVLRVAQEALLNAARHARAERITLSLDRAGDEFVLAVTDNGIGFDPLAPPLDGGDHFGLSIMRARAARVGGRLQIDSRPGRGTRVALSWSPDGAPSSRESWLSS